MLDCFSLLALRLLHQGDMVQYQLNRGASTIFELIPGEDEALTSGMVDNVMNCGQTPTFDRCVVDVVGGVGVDKTTAIAVTTTTATTV